MNVRLTVLIAAILGASGVALGAYHAHGLEGHLVRTAVPEVEVAKRLEDALIAVRYQMLHALALLAVVALAQHRDSICLATARWLFLLGVVLFAGGLYLTVFTGHVGHWAIIPSGGVLLICGWLAVAAHTLRSMK